MALKIIPASSFTLQELTDLYNQTRVDYMIPMPMNADRLGEYVRDFDVDLAHSYVAREDDYGQVLGLAMLGVRPNMAWVTRLGVLPASRRRGTGSALMDALLEAASRLNLPQTLLEVIKDNTPAHQLFLQKQFRETGEYLVLRRAPRAATLPMLGRTHWLERLEALKLLENYPHHLTWINDQPSMQNASNVQGVRIELPDGSAGWLVFRYQRFSLSHLILHTESGNPEVVGRQLLFHLHARHPRQDSYAENILQNDPHLPAFYAAGYFDNFRRIEMLRSNS